MGNLLPPPLPSLLQCTSLSVAKYACFRLNRSSGTPTIVWAEEVSICRRVCCALNYNFGYSLYGRAKASLKKRSNALANLQPTAAGGLSLGKRKSLHNAPDSTWGVLRATQRGSTPNTMSPNPLNHHNQQQQPAPGKQALIAELMNKTNFSTESIFQMSRRFKLIAGTAKSVISFDEFRQIMSEDVGDLLVSIGALGGDVDGDGETENDQVPPPGGVPATPPDMTMIGATISSSETFLRRLFLTFDVDGDGKIDFREFVIGLNGFVKGSLEEKVHALFEIYRSDAAGEKETVAISDLLGLFQGDRHLYQELMRCVDEYFARVELRDELQPTMKEDEFVAASVAEPHLLDMVSRPVPSRRYAAEGHVREKIRALIEHKKLNWKKLLDIHRRMVGYVAGGIPSEARGARRRSSVATLAPSTPSTPSTGGVAGDQSSAGDEDYNAQSLTIPVADFHAILVECLGPTTSSSPLEDEALVQSILLAYVAAPREKVGTPQAATAPGTPDRGGLESQERKVRPGRRACTCHTSMRVLGVVPAGS